ncbi:cytochrome c oxidase subunit 8A, mitochondrial-like [Mus musculus]|uniref:cytochrome c oxidase subunit 8A, mitochondrial-like n=1 Tax=Mus musculus TaxID=10090 RepID=UPI0016738CB5|nr:cytochrome c oxidase subunit 8A, mitochondrial-like [Mus musculus]
MLLIHIFFIQEIRLRAGPCPWSFHAVILTTLLLRSLTDSAWLMVPRAQVHSKPAREQLGVLDITIGLTSCFVCCLLPARWVLSHLESYKKRE